MAKFEIEDGTVIEIESFGEFCCLVCGEWYPMEKRHSCLEAELGGDKPSD
jgi:hypothetical protein